MEALSHKLFLGQIPKAMGEVELRPLLEPYGSIQDLTIIRDKVTGQHRGCAFLTYSSREEAVRCIQGLHNIKVLPPLTNPMQVKFADEPQPDRGDHKLFIGMLPKTTTEDDLRPLFERYGNVESLTVLRGANNASKGCAFVKYSTRDEALQAIQFLNGTHTMEGAINPIVVKFADTPRQKEIRRQVVVPQPMYGQPYPAPSPPTQMNMNPYYPAPPQPQYNPMMGNPGPHSNANIALQYLANYTGLPQINPPTNAMPQMAPMAPMAQMTQMGGAPMAPLASPQTEGPPGANLFIYHIPQDYTDANLALVFAPFGNIVSAKVFVDKNTGQSKCFGFVSYDSPEAAHSAITHMNGFQIGNKRLKVQLKRSNQVGGARPY